MNYTRLSTNQLGDSFTLLNAHTVLYSFYNDKNDYRQEVKLLGCDSDVSTILADPFGQYVLLYGSSAFYIFKVYRNSAGYPCLFYRQAVSVGYFFFCEW